MSPFLRSVRAAALPVAALLGAVSAVGSASGSPAARTAGSPAPRTACLPPYAPSSPWNRPISRAAAYDSRSTVRVERLGDELSSNPDEYTYPVYESSPTAPSTLVRVGGTYSDVARGGRGLVMRSGATVRLHLPPSATPSPGSDGQLILLDRRTGDEWGFWQLHRDASGRYSAENGYHYNTRWSGVPPHSRSGNAFGSRGAGVTYLAGLIRPCEIAQGHIDHALALAYDSPSPHWVFPASKSDGGGNPGVDMPEGARLRLDPSLSRARLTRLGCRGACLIIARAMQVYGMYIIDNSGHAKVMAEDNRTAHWRGRVTRSTVSHIPVSALRLLRSS